jgi:serine/threonine protein kinase
VFHRDLKPKNVLANADCKLKICDFGLARVAFNDAPTTIFWTVRPYWPKLLELVLKSAVTAVTFRKIFELMTISGSWTGWRCHQVVPGTWAMWVFFREGTLLAGLYLVHCGTFDRFFLNLIFFVAFLPELYALNTAWLLGIELRDIVEYFAIAKA